MVYIYLYTVSTQTRKESSTVAAICNLNAGWCTYPYERLFRTNGSGNNATREIYFPADDSHANLNIRLTLSILYSDLRNALEHPTSSCNILV